MTAKILAFPADDYGCGHFRAIWPAELCHQQGLCDISVRDTAVRKLDLLVRDDRVVEAYPGEDCNVVIIQRPTHKYLVDAIPLLRKSGVAVVVDMDDDLSRIHKTHTGWHALNPDRHQLELRMMGHTNELQIQEMAKQRDRLRPYPHSWTNVEKACAAATLVTVSTAALLDRYAPHGRGVVIPNFLPDHYYGVPREDSDLAGWPAVLHAHPNDPSVLGTSIRSLMRDRVRFATWGDQTGVREAFKLSSQPIVMPNVEIMDWPTSIANLGIGIAPLANTDFNAAKSWLKPLELSAVGVPWIASPRTEYLKLHQFGAGWIADRPGDWYSKIRKLARSADLRAELSERGKTVAEGLRLRDHAHLFAQAWETAYQIEQGAELAEVSG